MWKIVNSSYNDCVFSAGFFLSSSSVSSHVDTTLMYQDLFAPRGKELAWLVVSGYLQENVTPRSTAVQ